jgi:hypothetical protein
VPKETKKFINPLLRPSQSIEPAPIVQAKPQLELPELPEPEVVPVVEDIVRTQSKENASEQTQNSLSIATPVPSEPEPVIEETPPVITSNDASNEVSSEANTETSTKKAKSGNSASEGDALETDGLSTSTTRRKAVVQPLEQKSKPASEPALREISPRPRQSAPRVERTTYTSLATARTKNDFPNNNSSDDESFNRNNTDEESRPGIKRRRHIQPFESTHERITLWIDKELKEQFEDLAYRRALSKTALLNEAMADLLAKFEKH